MKKINIFYLFVVILGAAIFWLLKPQNSEELSFYGFAESDETEINYNYPVLVDRIMVTPGQMVEQGDTLLHISRVKSKERYEDQHSRIAELQSEYRTWKNGKQQNIEELEERLKLNLRRYQDEITALEKEIAYKKELAASLSSISVEEVRYTPLTDKITEIRKRIEDAKVTTQLKSSGLLAEINDAKNPLKIQIDRLQNELNFNQSQEKIQLEVLAPTDGIVGNVSCKEAEHVSSYTTLLSFYEPHTSLIKGYVHEDLTLQVSLDDNFEISSLKDPTIKFEGKVIGLGSRIVEIPPRLRKLVDFKTYGREVLVEIPKDNSFLLKEKVSLSLLK